MTTAYHRSPRALHRNAGRDILAMIPGADEVHLVSGPAAVMWDLLSRDAGLDELIREIAELYQQPVEEISPTLEVCLRDLTDRGLVEERGA